MHSRLSQNVPANNILVTERYGFKKGISTENDVFRLKDKKKNSVALVREGTIPTERPPPVGEVSANFYGYRGVTWSAQRIPTAVNLCFLDRSRYFLFK